ncbi:hypothetical protein [Nostoc sp. NMS8]|uniref:hypothetical protein n=1 Tax=Nostoc sp. NMS8 TaxID=2815392 RepID=UPI0025E31CDD|nr:hypothetical protein [Nostoc sp. NMS8]MBN3958384.1 hypothetical protein [Nostoc sp. NMS8]
MNKFVISSLLTLLIPVGYTLAQPVPSRQPVKPVTTPKATTIRLRDNSTLTADKLIPQAKIIARVNKKAVIKSIKLVHFGEHLATRKKVVGVESENPEISSNRLVYELITELTDFTIPRVGHFDRATITTIIDAETGETLSSDIYAPAGAFQSNHDALPPREQWKNE